MEARKIKIYNLYYTNYSKRTAALMNLVKIQSGKLRHGDRRHPLLDNIKFLKRGEGVNNQKVHGFQENFGQLSPY